MTMFPKHSRENVKLLIEQSTTGFGRKAVNFGTNLAKDAMITKAAVGTGKALGLGKLAALSGGAGPLGAAVAGGAAIPAATYALLQAGANRIPGMVRKREEERTAALQAQGDELRARREKTDERIAAIRGGTDSETNARVAEREAAVKAEFEADRATREAGGRPTRRDPVTGKPLRFTGGIGSRVMEPGRSPSPSPRTTGPAPLTNQQMGQARTDAQTAAGNIQKDLATGGLGALSIGNMLGRLKDAQSEAPAQRPSLAAQSMQGLDRDLAMARGETPNTDIATPGYVGSQTGVYVRGTPAERARLAAQAGIGADSSTGTLEREAAQARLQDRVLSPRPDDPLGGPPRDAQGNVVANTIRNRDAEMRSRYLKPGESDRTTSTGQRLVGNERDLTGRMYRDSEKEADRFRREDERREQEKYDNSVEGQMARLSSMTPEQRAAEINRLNTSNTRTTNVPASFQRGYKPETENEREFAQMRDDMGLAPRMSNRQMGQGRRRYNNQI